MSEKDQNALNEEANDAQQTENLGVKKMSSIASGRGSLLKQTSYKSIVGNHEQDSVKTRQTRNKISKLLSMRKRT